MSLEETGFGAVAVRGRWEEGVRLAASLGYDAVELAVRDPGTIDREAVRRAISDSGMGVAAIGTGQAYLKDGLSFTSDDAGIRARAIERMGAHIQMAGEYGAPVIVGLIRGRIGRDRAAAEGRFVEALTRLLPVAERGEVRLLIEPINRSETDFLNTIGEALQIIDRMGSSRVQVLADTYHMHIAERSVEDALRACGRRLGHVHVADSNRQAPGLGKLDFGRILEVLEEIGYGGFLSAEIVPVPDSDSAARQTVQHLRSLLTAANTEEGM